MAHASTRGVGVAATRWRVEARKETCQWLVLPVAVASHWVEMILQALEYENDQGKDLEEFFRSTAGKFQTDLGKAWASEIASRRKQQ